jgi:hypothetical protein
MQMYIRKVSSIFIAMKGTIHIGAGIGDHINASDLKTGAFFIKFFGCFPTQIITYMNRRQSSIGHESIRDGMAEVDVFHI